MTTKARFEWSRWEASDIDGQACECAGEVCGAENGRARLIRLKGTK